MGANGAKQAKQAKPGQTEPNGENSAQWGQRGTYVNGDQTGTNRAKQGPSGPNGTKHCQMRPNMDNPDQMVSNWAKRVDHA